MTSTDNASESSERLSEDGNSAFRSAKEEIRLQRKFARSEVVVRNAFVYPTLAILLFLIGYPFISVILQSFQSFSYLRGGTPRAVGLGNYVSILTDGYTWRRFQFTSEYTVIDVAIQLVLGVGIAYLIESKFRGRAAIFTIILVPMMLCPVVIGLFWRYMFNPTWGIIPYFLNTVFRIPIVNWLGNERYSLWAVIITDTWEWTPFMVLLASAGFSAVPRHLYEAAEVDRAGAWFRFAHITLPLAAPILLLAIVFRLMDALKSFDIIYTLTGGGPGDSTQTISYALYRDAFQYYNSGDAAAWAFIMLILIIGLSSIFIKLLNYLASRA